MVYPACRNLDVECRVNREKSGLRTVSLCLYHRSAQAGMQLLDVLQELQAAQRPVQRTVTFRDCARKATFKRLALKLADQREDLHVMHIRCDTDAPSIEMTDEGLELLRRGLNSWFAGSEDLCLAPRRCRRRLSKLGKLDRESAELWFWGPDFIPY